jgi:hypothetical protein
MSGDEPAVLFSRGLAAPPGVPRTLIVLGVARGGTTMLAQMLHNLGVFMGDGLNSTYQDALLGDISRALFAGQIDLDQPAIEQVMRRRDAEYAIWGWKFPTQIFEGLYAKARNPHMILVFRDPVAIAGREALIHGHGIEPCFERAVEQSANLAHFALATPYPCLAVSYERGLQRKRELVDALVDFAGIGASAETRQWAAEKAQPASPAYLEDTRPSEIEGMLDRADTEIAGWLRYPSQPEERVSFVILIDGAPIYAGVADRFRPDLQRAFNSSGRSAFAVLTPRHLLDGKKHKVTIAIPGRLHFAIGNNDQYWTLAVN